MANLGIHKRYVLQHAREKVFDIWVSPQGVVAPVTAIDVEPRKGGQFKLIVDGERQSIMLGKFLEFVQPSKLVYTWEWNNDGDVSQVTVVFSAVDEGTEIVIDHTGFAKESSRAIHDSGWDSYVAGINQLLESGP